MTVLLVLLTLILFLIADHFVQRSRAASTVRQLQFSQMGDLPSDVRLARNHTWIKVDKQGNVVVGLDEFLGSMIGPIEEVILPPVGTTVAPFVSNISLRKGRKSLDVAAPVSGRVVEVNKNTRTHPGVTSRDPYGDGWLVKIRSNEPATHWPLTMGGEKARAWLREQTELVKEFLRPRMPSPAFATMQDGGVPADGLLQQFDADVWSEFQQAFVSLNDPAGASKNPATEVRS